MMTLALGLRNQGCEVAVASSGQVQEHFHGPGWFEAHGIRHFDVPFPAYSRLRRDLGRALGAVAALGRAVKAFRPDIMHVHWRSTSPYARAVSAWHGLPFVSTIHLEQIPAGAYRFISFWGSRVIAVSSETRRLLVDSFGVDPARIRIVYNGADPEWFRPPNEEERRGARQALGLRGDEKVVCLIGRLERVKGHDVLLRALGRLRRKGMKVKAVFAGSGGEREQITALASREGVLDDLVMPGYADTREVLWASDVCTLPSRVEGFPLVVVEAMLCGVVPIRTPAGGATDQIDDGVNGFIVPFDDDDSLAERIRMLLENDGLRGRMAHHARLKALRCFTTDRMVSATRKVYEEVLKGRRE